MKKLTVKQLEKRMADGYAARQELEDRKDAKANKVNSHLVGTCQKFRNSYGAGYDDGPWWLYRRILSVNGMWCNSNRFQLTPKGHIDIDMNYHDSLSNGWLPCTESEYTSAWEALEDAMYSTGKRSQSTSASVK